MTDRKRMKDVVDSKMFMEILKSMSEDEFDDYISELQDLYQSVHPELEGE